MMGPTRLNSIPKGMLPVYEKIVGVTDDVCDRHETSPTFTWNTWA